jgi:hypothetical protein
LSVGGAGGGGGTATGSYVYGVRGGGVFVIIAQDIVVNTGYIVTDGNNGNGTGNQDGAGGAGGGGSILFQCRTINLGTNQVRAPGGTGGIAGQYGGYYGGNGGNGGAGRIAIHYSKTITGTATNPSYTSVLDPSLKETVGGAFLLNNV